MRLRPRQEQLVETSLAALNAHGNTLAVAPTGAGKTIMLSSVVGRAGLDKTLILQHRDELVAQNWQKFRLINPNFQTSIYDANTKSWRGRAVFGMVQTVTRNLQNFPSFDMLVIDEAHHATAPSYMRIIEKAREVNPDVRLYGVTATPNRGDGTPLRSVFDNCCDQVTIGELIASGHLVRPRTFVVDVGAQQALGQVRKLASDFDMAAVAAIMDRKLITDAVIEHWKEKAGTRTTIVFCSTVAHAQHVCEAFVAAGVKAEVIHGELGKTERAALLARFKRKEVQVLVNVAVLTEGFDYPPTDCVVLLRPSSYKSTMVQMVGRGLRTVNPEEFPGVHKTDCIVLDFGTASLTHGALEEEVNLDGKPTDGEAPTKECPECGATVPIAVMECPLCGYQWESVPKEKTELTDFVLTEIDLLAKSNFRWIDLWGDDRALIACGFEAWAGLFWWADQWHAIGGKQREVHHLGVGERVVALALGDDYLNEHEGDTAAHKSNRWLREPATDRQRAVLGITNPFDMRMTKYEASCRLSFKYNGARVQKIIFDYAKGASAPALAALFKQPAPQAAPIPAEVPS